MTNVPASGWHATVTANGYVHTVPVIDTDNQNARPKLNPRANARPGIRLPARKHSKWEEILGDGSDDIDLAVFHDGVRQPIDTLVDVEQTDRYTVLVGEGGRELRTRVEASFDQKAVHNAASDLVTNNTAYTANVDTPPTTTETNTTLVTLTTTSDFQTRTGLTDNFPVVFESGATKQAQTGFFTEAENADVDSGTRGTTGSEDDNYSGANGRVLEVTGDRLEFDVTPDHTIPADQVGAQARTGFESGSQSAPALEWTLNGVVIDFVTNPGTSLGSLGWDDIGDGVLDGDGYDGGDLDTGETYTLQVEVTDGGDAADIYPVDCVHVYDEGTDGRFTANYTFDDDTDANDTLDGPELFPDEVEVAFDLVPAPQAVTGIRAEATLNGGDSGYTHYASNDQGANFTTGTGANLETDSLGTAWGPGVTYKAGLSRFGSRTTASPNSGFSGQNLQSLTLKADLEDMPLVVNRTFDGHLDAILRELAEIGDQLWEYARDGDTESVEWTTPGQRTASQDPAISDFRATKTVGEVYQKAIVYGQPDVEVVGERFESNHGSAVSLSNDRLQQGSERVTDPDTGQRYRSGSDYTLDYQAGEITVLASGDMADASTFEVDYRHQAYGEFDDGTADPNVTPRIDLPGLWSNFLCKQAARLIIDEVSTPIHTAEVTIPNDETGWSVVESIDPDIVPTGGNALHIKEPVNTPESTVLTLGSRRTLSDVVGDIRAQTSAVTRKS